MLTGGSLMIEGVDPEPVEWLNPTSEVPVVLICEHAGQRIPQNLKSLGLGEGIIELHVAWDVGAGAVTRLMAGILGCTAVLQRYSRIVIDCNRPTHAMDAIPAITDGVTVPGNQGLTDRDRDQRIAEIFDPFNEAVTEARSTGRKMLLSIHSFTPELLSIPGKRPWHMGFLFRRDAETSARLIDAVRDLRPNLILALNEPYSIDAESDWFVPHHGEGSGLPHSLVEIRHDLITDENGQSEYAALLSQAVKNLMETSC